MAGCENVGVRWKNPTKKRANLESLNISRGEAISTWKNVKLKVLTIQPCPTLYDPINSHRLPEEPTRLLCPWNCLGKSTGVAYHSLLQGIFLAQESNLAWSQCLSCKANGFLLKYYFSDWFYFCFQDLCLWAITRRSFQWSIYRMSIGS